MSRNVRMIAAILGVGAGAAYLAPSFFNPTRTPGVKSIEARYTAAGATPDGEKAGATKLGNDESVASDVTSSQQKRIREQKDELLGGNTQAPKGDNKVFSREGGNPK